MVQVLPHLLHNLRQPSLSRRFYRRYVINRNHVHALPPYSKALILVLTQDMLDQFIKFEPHDLPVTDLLLELLVHDRRVQLFINCLDNDLAPFFHQVGVIDILVEMLLLQLVIIEQRKDNAVAVNRLEYFGDVQRKRKPPIPARADS